MGQVRKLRHWKQRYDPGAAFICRRRIEWGGVAYEPGDPVPEELVVNKGKLRRFWEAGWIELAQFEAPKVATGQPPEPTDSGLAPYSLPIGATLERRGSWHIIKLSDGTEYKAQGIEAYHELLEELTRDA